jgi:Ca-activated chloride channel homolog
MKRQMNKMSAGIALFAATALATVAGTFGFGQTPAVSPMPVLVPVPVSTGTPGFVTVRGTLSQTKVLQHSTGELFMDLVIEAPEDRDAKRVGRRATDMIVILDRSGSMADANKITFAKAAIRDLTGRLNEQDRFALVSFDDYARVDFPLAPITPASRSTVNGIIEGIQAGASTNIGDGFEGAGRLISETGRNHRFTRVLLLSDGEATTGVTDPEGLTAIVKRLVKKGAVVSAIGMGLGFNQSLLSQLADHGMGNYAYLESLESLGQILNKDLVESRALYASTSGLTIQVADGVTIQDASGYPVESIAPNRYQIKTGQLVAGAKKSFMVTFHVPTHQKRNLEIAKLSFDYDRQSRTYAGQVAQQLAQVSVIEDRVVAQASIVKDVYQKGWVTNNLGRLKANFGSSLSKMDAGGARSAIANYKEALKKAEAEAGVPMASAPAVAAEMKAMEDDLEQSAAGDKIVDTQAANRAAKKQHSGARLLQRSN